MTFQSLCVA